MASLTETAHYTRRLIRIGIIGLVAFFVFRIIQIGVSNAWKSLRPVKGPEPTFFFGKLPPIDFPDEEPSIDLTFKLETIQGRLPAQKKLLKVYFIPKEIYTYLTLERAERMASKMGFSGKATRTSEIMSLWRIEEAIPSYLTMDIIEQNFIYHYSYERDQSLLNVETLLTPEQAASKVRSFLSRAGSLPEDINKGPKRFIYYQYAAPSLREVASLSEADFIKVNLFRQAIGEIALLSPRPRDANVSALVSKDPHRPVIDLKFNYFPVDEEVWGTYPLKDVTKAWDELKKGQAYIASLGENPSGHIIVRKVSLAYFDPPNHQSYLQPIFVFEGDKAFKAYVPAVSAEWIEEQVPAN
jgi:hypothetical protein